ncbi:MAG: serine/threonine-protein kinase [Pirellulaceae bacterium]
MHDHQDDIASEDYESELAILISQLSDRMAAGESITLENSCQANPKFADDLRDLWGMLVVTEIAASEQRSEAKKSFNSGGLERSAPQLSLPCRLGNFELEEELGRGGMGIVYRASRISDGQTVAIKVMLKGEFASSLDRQRFEAEAEAAAAINHPNVIPIYEVGEELGRPFFCMKWIKGRTLAQWLADGPIPSKTAADLLLKIGYAINAAHRNGVLHRDLKPSNILLDENSTPFVCDFGLAKLAENPANLTKSGAVLGTPSYMAPEQAAGARGQVNETTDVYSLGAILYHMLTGRPPFMASTPVDTVLLVLEQDPTPPRVINRLVDPKLEAVALKCLQKPQDLRYQSVQGLCSDLEAFLNRRPVSAAEGRFAQVVGRFFRETHHAPILQNWGLLWMWHSLVVLLASVATNLMYLLGVTARMYYEAMWIVGLGAWAIVFWKLRKQVGPVTFVERQMAHIWAAAIIGVMLLFPFEGFLGLGLLKLAPILSVVAAMTFIVKAGILSGTFYIQAGVLLLTAVVMACYPDNALFLFGVVCAACYFLPGMIYYRQRLQSERNKASSQQAF